MIRIVISGFMFFLFSFHVKARVETRWRRVFRREFSLSGNQLDHMLINKVRGRGKPGSGWKPEDRNLSMAVGILERAMVERSHQ
jgi:hypothetical protein